MASEAYPASERCPYFAMKFIRKLVKEVMAQEVGQTGFIFLSVIATTEDASGYRRAVTYTDAQLLPILGVSSTSTISLARKKCVEAGWLHYEPGCRGKPSRYWVKLPRSTEEIDDLPTDEGHDDGKDMIIEPIAERIPSEFRTNTERIPNANRALLPIPVPEPIPKDYKANESQTGAQGLAFQFVFHWTNHGRKQQKPLSPIEIEPQFAEYLRLYPGDLALIESEIKSPNRFRGEWPDKMLARLIREHHPEGKHHGKRQRSTHTAPGGGRIENIEAPSL